MTLKEAIAKRILELSQAKNLSPYALAMLCGIDKSTLYSILGSRDHQKDLRRSGDHSGRIFQHA